MIKNIIFDMGNVILDYNPEQITRCFTDNDEDVKIFTTELFSNKEWVMLDQGLIDECQAFKGICERIPERLYPLCAEILMTWYKYFRAIDAMIPVVRELKERGYQLYMLTNAHLSFWKYHPNSPAFGLMDGFVVSSEEKILKPDERIYRILLERFGLKAEECFFTDDAPANIEGAAKVGIRGHIFDGDPQKLLDAIRNADK